MILQVLTYLLVSVILGLVYLRSSGLNGNLCLVLAGCINNGLAVICLALEVQTCPLGNLRLQWN